ncbi:ATP-binding protein [Cupriavidus metallidurans]|uniref:ATP-binding protein n=1 Tax=Cupriavidus TaxID=106589 RepID=UPI000E9D19AB|nr:MULTISPECIES: ATP-binding protein [unclassified Cupriavidus]GMG92269.1 sensor histidine kinase [Cupriavidus sp. TKC]HBO82855.1 two-component sensor histidine kinase [Cupriavidus sp.]
MAGAEGRLKYAGPKHSVQQRLSLWVSLAILAVALIGGIFSFASAFREANIMQDDLLRQVSMLFDAQHLPAPHLADAGRLPHSDEEARVIVQTLSPGGDGSRQMLALPASAPDGLGTFEVDHESYRVLIRTLPTGQRIAVAQETGMRDEIARNSAQVTVLPFLVLVPVLLLIVAYLVHQMFRPISTLSTDIDRRGEHELYPLPEDELPAEVRPFVVAINRLLARIAQAMEMQRRFVADAAHELRSPMTALSLQAERLERTEMPEAARTRLATLRRGIERSRALLEQLLSLARAQSATAAPAPAESISVRHAFRRVLEDLMPLADSRHIDIGAVGDTDAQVPIQEVELITLLKNLVDNAIRYTPEHGRVDLSVETSPNAVAMIVTDSGPGISTEERSRIFDPFYRIPGNDAPGSGLGLSIVRVIAERVGATVEIDYADAAAHHGTRVTVRVPCGDNYVGNDGGNESGVRRQHATAATDQPLP